ncbi:4F2 cell-surface antigen heavy chain-like, partial [Seriola lalandi dorsalis]|uniref:4F2 cell-surface antigen heavy chain-like n=1 Tax=Seriola lalandi dorsalis TaxID=1841481 RepID=UPI000C6F922D
SQLLCSRPSGLEQKVDSLSQLKVKGLVVGPIHVAPPDDAMSLRFEEMCIRDRSRPGPDPLHVTGAADHCGFWVFSRVLIGITERSSAEDVSSLLSSTHVDLLISRVLRGGDVDATERAQSVQFLYSNHSQTKLAWNLGGRVEGHLASLVGPALVKLHQLLLLTLPGTPVFNYGDEIGLMDEGTKFPKMLWDSNEGLNETLQEERAERLSCRRFFRSVSELRGKERSLMFGDFVLLSNSSSSLAYLRVWDQSTRYVAAFNWAAEEAAVLQLSDAALPRQAAVVISTNSSALPADSSVDLMNLYLGPGQAALLKFPYTG